MVLMLMKQPMSSFLARNCDMVGDDGATLAMSGWGCLRGDVVGLPDCLKCYFESKQVKLELLVV